MNIKLNKAILIIIISLAGMFLNAQLSALQWAKGFGGSLSDNGVSIDIDLSGNVYTSGYFDGIADFDPGPGTFTLSSVGLNDIFITKFDASGNFVWAKTIGGTMDDIGLFVKVDNASGNIYITGSFQGTVDFDPGIGVTNLTCVGGSDVFVLKLNLLGNFVWAKSMGVSLGRAIDIDASGNVCLTGEFGATSDFDPGLGVFNLTSAGNYDVYVLKLDPSGNFLWAKQISGVSDDGVYSMKIDLSGNIYAAGYFDGVADFDPGSGVYSLSPGVCDAFILKLDATGNFVWAKNIGGSSCDISQGLSLDLSGNVYTTGFFKGTCDFDPSSGIMNLTSLGSDDIFILKLNSLGNFVWAKQIGGIFDDSGTSIKIDASGNVYTTGFFSGIVDFDPGVGLANLGSSGGYDIFISKLDASGNFKFAKSMGGLGDDGGASITVNGVGNLYLLGLFENTADFDPDGGISNLTSNGNDDVFVVKMESILGVNENANSITANIYPNPTSNSLNIEFNSDGFDKLNGILYIEISNALGQVVLTESIISQNSQINTKSLSKGLYFLKIVNENKIIGIQKLIKE